MQGVGDKDIILGQGVLGMMKAARRHIDLIGRIVVGERELGTAVGAEGARGVGRGPEAGRFACCEAEVLGRHGEPCHRRRAAGTVRWAMLAWI